MVTLKQRLNKLTETAWYTPKYLTIQQKLRSAKDPVTLDFSQTTWFDLWPLAQLTKIVYERLTRFKRPLIIELPISLSTIKPHEKFKPLCFLVDSGFLGLFIKYGGHCRIQGKPVSIEYNQETASRLAERSLDELERHGYQRKAYKDQILVPLTPVASRNDVEHLKTVLHDYVEEWLKFYEKEIAEGDFIDIFYRELTENSVEHAEGATAFVAARLLRSIWDLPEKSRRDIQRIRSAGKLPSMKFFLTQHENEGFLELVVVDDGPGIEGTLDVDSGDRKKAGGVFRYAMRPDVSRLELKTRLNRKKSPLTGLGECASCLEHLPGMLMFRESNGGTYCYPNATKLPGELVNLGFTNLRRYKNETTRGCNVQLALAISPLSLQGKKIVLKDPVAPSFVYLSLFSGDKSRPKSVKVDADFTQFVSEALTQYSNCIIDLSGASADKDTAWHVMKKILPATCARHAPVVLVGITRPFVTRLNDAINEIRTNFHKYGDQFQDVQSGSQVPQGWLALSTDLELHFIGGTPEFSDYVSTGVISGSFPTWHKAFRKVVEQDLHLCNYSGQSVSLNEVFWSWQAGVSSRIVSLAKSKGYVMTDVCVELPNGDRTERYMDLYELARDSEIRPLLAGVIEREIMRTDPQIIVTYSSLARQLCADVLRKSALGIGQVDLPTPYSIASTIASLKHYRLKKALIFADVVNTGSHVLRIVRGCGTVPLHVLSAFALLDSHPDTRIPECGTHYNSLLRLANLPAVEEKNVTHRVDPYTSALQRMGEKGLDPMPHPRDEQAVGWFYNFVTRQKAIVNRHCSNQAGHHFVLAIDFRQLVRKDALTLLIQHVQRFARRCSALIVPAESVIGGVVEEVAEKLGFEHDQILWAVESRKIVRERRLSPSDEAKLRNVAHDKEPVLFLDDAIHHGQGLTEIAAYVAQCGLKQLHAWFILDNRPPGAAMSERVSYDGVSTPLSIRTGALMRSFFPVFTSPLSCPYCRMAEAYHRALQSHPNALLEEYINIRLAEIFPIDLKTAVLDPWRHSATETISVPSITDFECMPDSVISSEAFEMALWEMSQYEEGIMTLFKAFKGRQAAKYDHLFGVILSKNIATLEKLGLRREYVQVFRQIVREWTEDNCSKLFETALLWPLEVLTEEICGFIQGKSDAMLCSDSCLAILHALIHYTLQNCGEGDRKTIIKAMESVQKETPKDLVTYGLVQSVFSFFTQQGDPDRELLWALTSLAKRLLEHREPRHRIYTQIPNLAATLTAEHVESTLGLGSDDTSDIQTFAIFYYLAEVGGAIATLVRLGHLNKSPTIDRLLSLIQMVMQHRAELREQWVHEQKPSTAYVQEKVELIKESLSEIGRLLSHSNPDTQAQEVFILLKARIFKLYNDFIEPLCNNLKRSIKIPVRLEDSIQYDTKNIHIVAEPDLLKRVIDSVTQNVADNFAGELFSEIIIGGEIDINGRCAVFVNNPCDHEEAEEKFRAGPDFISLSAPLYRFGARYTGRYDRARKVFTTGILFATIV